MLLDSQIQTRERDRGGCAKQAGETLRFQEFSKDGKARDDRAPQLLFAIGFRAEFLPLRVLDLLPCRKNPNRHGKHHCGSRPSNDSQIERDRKFVHDLLIASHVHDDGHQRGSQHSVQNSGPKQSPYGVDVQKVERNSGRR